MCYVSFVDVFTAIADPVRRSLLEQLARSGAQRVVDLTAGRGISRPAISRHLRVLHEAGLVSVEDQGRERHYALVPDPLRAVAGWIDRLPSQPPVTAHQLDALDLEVRRTTRERQTTRERRATPGTRAETATPTTAGGSA